MSVINWFEDKRKFGGLIGAFLEEATKGSISSERERDRRIIINTNKGLWARCDNCGNMLHVRFLKQNKSVREERGYHLSMNSTERIELSIDRDTWIPMDEEMTAKDVLGFSDEDSHQNRIAASQEKTGLTDAVQTGIGYLNGTPIALGVMDFHFMGGSMGSVVGEKITRSIEYATHDSLPLIIIRASGGARMQEGTLSLMQMAKISSVLQTHQIQKRLLYISVLTYPTTGGVTASSGMSGDIIIAESKAYTAFAGKRVIEQTLRQKIPDGFQAAESLFDNGPLDLIVPRNLLKGVLSEISEPYSSAPYKKK
uniref:Acetyl-coenzyme A carboxylase carboxyl transferase subunit beta, chloroplastic n=1 Tax=Cibotium barometz TaxID=29588 RepID=A0A2S1PV69_CIBBA|nr:acetyl-CoA carboxylase, carboxyl transferase subunit beta [Cibotium barometz]YP_010878732.1 acetyl-CoA carboxylase, carboxyl transferase subunit beta [Cibotium cumingii]WHE38187.1 acetyl-CoA carboxylase, carboxyl transferase subunit beta [Cibotium sinoburmaense]AWH62711.1 acetyl-CoA carboxylase, carboxyl transferase subunit beta [Cibotium barometz]WHE37925.1 acetyl-CoA carboxylase, carboxyl transferase subunit beta [Cibotium barometz]WHE38012.1 acetyl-CoA carboxylase, carboxyl transferase s